MPDDSQFIAKGQEFIKQHPDFHEALQGAAKRGLDLHPDAVDEIKKLASPDVAYYLASPEGYTDALALHFDGRTGMKGEAARDRVRRIAHRLAAQRPYETYERPVSATDKALRKRKQDIRSGERGRR
jgi:hypothetical protein